MKCLKISHRVILSSLFALFALPFLFSSGRASASSYSQTYTSSNFPAGQTWSAANNFNNELSFTPTYLLVEVQLPSADSYSPVKIFDLKPASLSSWGTSYCAPDSTGYCSFLTNVAWGVRWASPNNGNFTTVKYTWYDFNPANAEPCPVCPEVPEETEVLLDIKKSILFIPAMIFVIYLFYILYSFYIGGSR